jgi:hypothetical protein
MLIAGIQVCISSKNNKVFPATIGVLVSTESCSQTSNTDNFFSKIAEKDGCSSKFISTK